MNQILPIVLAGCVWTVGAICAILIFHRHYVTGVIRTAGLALIAVAAFARGASLLTQNGVDVSNVGIITWIGLALFFVSHFRGFTGRCKRKGPSWYDPDRTQIMKR